MSRHRAPTLVPERWYADARGGEFTSFLKFLGHNIELKQLFFDEMRGYPSAYPKYQDVFVSDEEDSENVKVYSFSVEITDWFEPTKEDIERWDLG